MRIRFFSFYALIFPVLGIFLFYCNAPIPPRDAAEADVKLILKSSTGEEGTVSITDTVGNIDTIGVILRLTQHIRVHLNRLWC